ncbi:putative Ig domain-containing protein, partial [Thioalkalivibrio sp.]|uniref:putative Ig domain-containing protein n=1 Tax=Thioalkalivibrio sp. TaxID=2093813 RepID=UPI00356961AD
LVAAAEPGTTEFDALSSGIQTLSSGFHNPLNDAVRTTAYVIDETQLEEINGVASMDSPDPVIEEDRTQDDGNTSDPVIEEDQTQDDGTTSDPVVEEDQTQDDGTTSDPVIEEDGTQDDGTRSDPVIEDDGTQDDGTPVTLWSNDGWLLFDGVSDVVTTNLSLPRLAGSSFTAEVTVQYTGETSRTWTPIFGASYAPDYTASESFFIGKHKDTDQLNINIGGLDYFLVSSDGLFDGRERHLALVFDDAANEFRVFVDQELLHRRTGVAGSLSTTSELLIGAVGHTKDERWMGWIGPARITDTALEPHEFLVSDGDDTALEPRPNSAPTLSGSPTTALVVGNPWSFTPTASDPDGDVLTFAIQGKPGWASFDTETGRLWGTPTAGGSYDDITITVSDDMAETSLDPFTLQVDEPTLGTATVSWEPPTTRTDGSTLTDLAGYRVYYGKDVASLTHTVEITSTGQTSQHIENLDTGTWYFAVTALDSEGLESSKSEIGSKEIM